MTDTTTGNKRICPNCGHANTSYSLFCAECGESLNSSESGEDNGQTTALFTPVTTPQDTSGSSAPSDDRYATAEFTPQPAATTVDTDPGMTGWYAPAADPATYAPAPVYESRRGFWLGIIAAILILLIIGFFAWSTVASDGFRDTFTGIF